MLTLLPSLTLFLLPADFRARVSGGSKSFAKDPELVLDAIQEAAVNFFSFVLGRPQTSAGFQAARRRAALGPSRESREETRWRRSQENRVFSAPLRRRSLSTVPGGRPCFRALAALCVSLSVSRFRFKSAENYQTKLLSRLRRKK